MRSSRTAAQRSRTTRKGAWSVVALLAVIALALGVFSLPGAFAQSHQDKVLDHFPHPGDQVKAQIVLLDVVDALDAFLAEHQIEGLVGASVDENEGKLTIFWHGDVPNEVRPFLDEFSDRGHIQIHQVPVPLDELERLTVEILEAFKGEFVSGGPNATFDRLEFQVAPEHAEGYDYDGMEHELSKRTGLSIDLTPGEWAEAANTDRTNDVSPFWGGASVVTGEAACSTGFAARKQATGEPVLIASNHCDLADGEAGEDWVTEHAERFVGRVADDGHRSEELDTVLLTGESYDSAVFVGDAFSFVGAPVVGSSRNVIGALLTSSGAFTGEVGNNRTELVSQFILNDIDEDGDREIVGPVTVTTNLDGFAQAGGGDTGGPQVRAVVHPDDSNKFALHAQNVITAIDPSFEAECLGRDEDRRCSTRVFAVDVPRILEVFQLDLP